MLIARELVGRTLKQRLGKVGHDLLRRHLLPLRTDVLYLRPPKSTEASQSECAAKPVNLPWTQPEGSATRADTTDGTAHLWNMHHAPCSTRHAAYKRCRRGGLLGPTRREGWSQTFSSAPACRMVTRLRSVADIRSCACCSSPTRCRASRSPPRSAARARAVQYDASCTIAPAAVVSAETSARAERDAGAAAAAHVLCSACVPSRASKLMRAVIGGSRARKSTVARRDQARASRPRNRL